MDVKRDIALYINKTKKKKKMLESGIIVLQTPTTQLLNLTNHFLQTYPQGKMATKKKKKKEDKELNVRGNQLYPIYIHPLIKIFFYVLLSYTGAVDGRKPPTSQKEATSLRKREEGRAQI